MKPLPTVPTAAYVFGMLAIGFLEQVVNVGWRWGWLGLLVATPFPLIAGFAFAAVAQLCAYLFDRSRRLILSKWAFWFVVATWLLPTVNHSQTASR